MNLPGQVRKTVLTILWVAVASAVLTANAQIYKHVDEDGKVTFTDQRPPNAIPVEINPTNTTPPPSPSAYPETTPETSDDTATGAYYTVTISSPADETIIPRGPGNFSVSANVTPGLYTVHTLQLLIDGSPHGEAQRGTSWALTNIFRGEHKLEVAVMDGNGEQVAISASVTVFVFRPSSNFRSNRPTPRSPRPRAS
jgi:hypothetical protein